MHSDTLTHAPDPPDYLPRGVWPDWYEVTDELIRAGHTNPAYLLTVEAYCMTVHLERQAFKEATTAGLVYQVQGKAADGGSNQQSKVHPAWRVYLQLQTQARRLARSLLLTPQSKRQAAAAQRTAIRRKGSGSIGTRHT